MAGCWIAFLSETVSQRYKASVFVCVTNLYEALLLFYNDCIVKLRGWVGQPWAATVTQCAATVDQPDLFAF